jgi:hypothetical protein
MEFVLIEFLQRLIFVEDFISMRNQRLQGIQ